MDAAALAKKCTDQIEYIKKNPTYMSACEIFDNSNTFQNGPKNIKAYEHAIAMFKSLDGFMDSNQRIEQCQAKIVQLKEQEELARKKEEKRRAEKQKRKEHRREVAGEVSKKSLKAAVIVVPIVVLAIFLTVLFTVMIPGNKYDSAMALKNEGKYEEAIAAFEALGDFRDSAEQISLCQTAIKDGQYQSAIDLMSQGQYEQAIAILESLGGHKDSTEQINLCRIAILDREYAIALNLLQQGKYDKAIAAFEALNGHKDSQAKINECYAAKDRAYEAAIALIQKSKYDEAIAALEALKNGDAFYKDSEKIIRLIHYIKSIKTVLSGIYRIAGRFKNSLYNFFSKCFIRL
jgi:tetratricopeptide (TPR) repeat protein